MARRRLQRRAMDERPGRMWRRPLPVRLRPGQGENV